MTETIDRNHSDRCEERCDRCGGPNPTAWWVDSDRWRIACTAFGGTVQDPAENPFLCPTCFITLWERQTGFTALWHLAVDPISIRTQGHDRWMELRSILNAEREAGMRPDPADAPEGHVWCEDPACAEWEFGKAGQYWNHLHPVA